jgi:beta-glucosidase
VGASPAEDALAAAKETLVLLKNTGDLLPIDASAVEYIVLVGEMEVLGELYVNYNNIGAQCGGWSVRWQGYLGNRFWSNYGGSEDYKD